MKRIMILPAQKQTTDIYTCCKKGFTARRLRSYSTCSLGSRVQNLESVNSCISSLIAQGH